MKKIIKYLNYIALALIIIGFALLRSFGLSYFPGLTVTLIGIGALIIYFALNLKQFKEKNSRLNFIFASNLALIVVLVIAIVGTVNFLGTKIHKRWDVSEGKTHSISNQSIKVAQNLKKELTVKSFFAEGNPSLFTFNSLMNIYKYYTDKIKIETIDPYKNPSMVKRYEIKRDGTVVFEYGNRDNRIEEVSEETITNAIIKVTREQEKTILFTQGHGEPDPDKNDELGFSEVKSNLEKLSFKVKKTFLFQESEVPENTSVLVVAGAQKPLFEKELLLIENHIFQKQGKVVFLIDPFTADELKPLLKKIGAILHDDVIVEVDPLSRFMGGDYFMPVVAKYTEHDITKNFGFATMFPMARSLSEMTPLPKNTQVTVLASTSPNSWGEINYQIEAKTKKITKNPEDQNGPLNMAAAIETGSEPDKKARIVVVGDSDFALNKYYYFQANGNFFNNIIAWLAQEGDLIAIAPKTTAPRMIHLTESSGRLIFFYTLIILPLLVFITGIGIWIYRRKL